MRLTLPLILVQWAAGVTAGVALVHRLAAKARANLGPGFTWLLAGSAAGIALLGVATRAAVVAVAIAAGALVQILTARSRPVAVDAIAVVAGVGATIVQAIGDGADALGVTRAMTGAAVLGSVTTGMVVGHWYLVDTSLPRAIIRRVNAVFLGATVLEIAALLAPDGMVRQLGVARAGFNAVLPWFWIALAALTAVLGVAVAGALRERSYSAVMAATGLLYLAIITAFGVDVLAKALIARSL